MSTELGDVRDNELSSDKTRKKDLTTDQMQDIIGKLLVTRRKKLQHKKQALFELTEREGSLSRSTEMFQFKQLNQDIEELKLELFEIYQTLIKSGVDIERLEQQGIMDAMSEYRQLQQAFEKVKNPENAAGGFPTETKTAEESRELAKKTSLRGVPFSFLSPVFNPGGEEEYFLEPQSSLPSGKKEKDRYGERSSPPNPQTISSELERGVLEPDEINSKGLKIRLSGGEGNPASRPLTSSSERSENDWIMVPGRRAAAAPLSPSFVMVSSFIGSPAVPRSEAKTVQEKIAIAEVSEREKKSEKENTAMAEIEANEFQQSTLDKIQSSVVRDTVGDVEQSLLSSPIQVVSEQQAVEGEPSLEKEYSSADPAVSLQQEGALPPSQQVGGPPLELGAQSEGEFQETEDPTEEEGVSQECSEEVYEETEETAEQHDDFPEQQEGVSPVQPALNPPPALGSQCEEDEPEETEGHPENEDLSQEFPEILCEETAEYDDSVAEGQQVQPSILQVDCGDEQQDEQSGRVLQQVDLKRVEEAASIKQEEDHNAQEEAKKCEEQRQAKEQEQAQERKRLEEEARIKREAEQEAERKAREEAERIAKARVEAEEVRKREEQIRLQREVEKRAAAEASKIARADEVVKALLSNPRLFF